MELVPAQVREPDSPYYRINPSGRVPWLLRDDGTGLEESALICAWLDALDGRPAFACRAMKSAGAIVHGTTNYSSGTLWIC